MSTEKVLNNNSIFSIYDGIMVDFFLVCIFQILYQEHDNTFTIRKNYEQLKMCYFRIAGHLAKERK